MFAIHIKDITLRSGIVKVIDIIEKIKKQISNFHDSNLVSYTKVRIVSLIGIIGFPLYYIFWKYLFPQPYESEVLRFIGFTVCVVLFFHSWLRIIPSSYFSGFAFISYTYILPFFFTYMLIQNQGGMVWQLSMMASLLYLFIIMSIGNATLCFFLGFFSAAIASLLLQGYSQIHFLFDGETGVIYGFTFAGAILLSHGHNIIQRERLEAAKLVAGNLAHEIRTPLSGICLEVEQIKMACKGGDSVLLSDACKAIDNYTSHTYTLINNLLSEICMRTPQHQKKVILRVSDLIDSVLKNYPFQKEDKEKIDINIQHNFQIYADKQRIEHVVVNLIKNAIRAINEVSKGKIKIISRKEKGKNQLVVLDTAGTLRSDIMPFIFFPFFSQTKTTRGNGLGLSFCKKVIDDMRGRIFCKAIYKKRTEFIIEFKGGK